MFAQEHRGHCETLLANAENAMVELAIPSFCLGEPLETLRRRHSDRRNVQNALQNEVRQLRRVTDYRTDPDDVDLTINLFTRSATEDLERLQRYYHSITEAATLTP